MLIGASISHLELEPLETQCSLTLSDLFNHIYLKSDIFISREHSEQIEWKHYSTPFLVAGYIMEVLGSKQLGVLLLIPVCSHLNSSAVFPWLFIWMKSWSMLWLFVQRQKKSPIMYKSYKNSKGTALLLEPCRYLALPNWALLGFHHLGKSRTCSCHQSQKEDDTGPFFMSCASELMF